MPVSRYHFHAIAACNMCGEPTDHHPVLGRRLNQSQGRSPWKKPGIAVAVQRCTNCGLIYSNPQPVPVDLQDHYGVPPEEYWTDAYFTVKPGAYDHDMSRLKTLMDFTPGMRFLDIGAGVGHQMIYYEGQGFDVHGIEPSVPFHARAIARMGIPPERLDNVAMEDATFPTAAFDFISFGVVLEHLYDPSEALAQAMHWLKPGGLVHIEVPSAEWLINRLSNVYYRLRGSDYVGNISPMHPPYHLHEFSLEAFHQNGARNGYRVAHHDRYVCPTYMPRIFDRPLRWIMQRTGTGMQLSVWLKRGE